MNPTAGGEERILEALAKVPLFSGLDDRSRRKLAKLCTLKKFKTGDVLYEEGAMGLSMFLVTSGQVEVYKGKGEGKVTLEKAGPGGVLGQLALIDERPRAAGAAALEPTECLLLTRDSFETLVKKDPQIAWCLTPALADRIRGLQGLAAEAKLAEKAAIETPRAADSAGPAKAGAKEAKAGEPEKGQKKSGAEGKAKAKKEPADDDKDDDDEASDIESAMFKMMRMQFGMMAGAAKGMTEMAHAMETFLDSMAEETDFKTRADWGDLLKKMPDAMVTATRAAMDDCDRLPEEMVDAYRRYCDEEK